MAKYSFEMPLKFEVKRVRTIFGKNYGYQVYALHGRAKRSVGFFFAPIEDDRNAIIEKASKLVNGEEV